MSALPWFRMYSRLVSDPDVEDLSTEDQRHFVWLLCFKNEGYLDKGYESDKLDRVVARKLGVSVDELAAIKARLLESGLIGTDWQPRSWDELQKPSDSSTTRVRAHRAKKKAGRKVAKQDETPEGNVTETADETEPERPSNALDKSRERGEVDTDCSLPSVENNNNAREARTDVVVEERAELATMPQAANELASSGWRRLQAAHPPPDTARAPPDAGGYAQRLLSEHGYTEREARAGDSVGAAKTMHGGAVTLDELDAAARRAADDSGQNKPLGYLLAIIEGERKRSAAKARPMAAPPAARRSGDILAGMFGQSTADDGDVVATQSRTALGGVA